MASTLSNAYFASLGLTVNPQIFGGKPIIRGRRLAVEHVLGMLAAGDTVENILEGYPWLEREDVQACLVYARRIAANERIEPFYRGRLLKVLLDTCVSGKARDTLKGAGHDVIWGGDWSEDPGD